jgi:hypothetical protein
MKTKIKTITAIVVTLAAAASTYANGVSGSISFTGTPTGLTDPLSADTSFGTSGVDVSSVPADVTGSYASLLGDTGINFPGFAWSGSSVSGLSLLLWSYTVGATTYSFTATTGSATFIPSGGGAGQWVFSGAGTAAITLDTSESGTWSVNLSETKAGANVTFAFDATSASDVPPPSTPDGGLTVALLGGAMVGLQGLRRKFGC